MPKKVFLTDAQLEDMRKARAEGKSDAEIGREHGLRRTQVSWRLGPSGRPRGIPPKTTPEQVADMAKQGMNDQRIAEVFKLSPKQIGKLRNCGGVKYRPWQSTKG